MKTFLILVSAVVGFGLCGCHTAHKVEDGTEHAAKKVGHAVGHATEKVGTSVAKGGKKLENKTEQ